MEIKESIRAALKELILPGIDKLREESAEIKATLALTNKRLDDINVHLADQSRRIDAVREELGQRIDGVREELGQKIDGVREELGQRIDSVRDQLRLEIKETNRRLDRLFEIIVRREEHIQVTERVAALERDVAEMKRKLAA
jgi:transcription antitermination factor NusA-like protein